MRTVQLMKKMSDASKNVFRVYHIRIIAPKKKGSHLEYNGTFTKLFILFMHVSSRNMFPTIKNLQIRVHVYRPCHCCGDCITADNYDSDNRNAKDIHVNLDLKSFGVNKDHTQCSVDEKNVRCK
jgi:hypothetical protein